MCREWCWRTADNWNGRVPPHAMRKGTPFWENYVSELIQKKLNELPQAVRIVWDIEPGAKDYCYCAVCRKNFSGSVSSGKTLTAEEIRRNHAAEWFRFRVKQNAEIIKRFAELCRRKFPGKELVLCTDPLACFSRRMFRNGAVWMSV